MPDDNRLQGIGEKLDGDEADDAPEADEADDAREASESQASQESGASDIDVSDEPAAFSTDESAKTTVYGREETLSEYSKALDLIRARAIEKHDLDDIEARELHDAALRIVPENIDEAADRVAESRE